MAIKITIIACRDAPVVITLEDDMDLIIESTYDRTDDQSISITDDANGNIKVENDDEFKYF